MLIDGPFGYDGGWRVDMHPRGFTDVNGDGVIDVWGFNNHGLKVAFGIDGYSFESPVLLIDGFFGYNQGWTVEDDRRFIDVNQDGHLDISGWKDGQHWVSLSIDGVYFEDAVLWEQSN